MNEHGVLIVALKEAIFARECEITYDAKHPGVVEPDDLVRYYEELELLRSALKSVEEAPTRATRAPVVKKKRRYRIAGGANAAPTGNERSGIASASRKSGAKHGG